MLGRCSLIAALCLCSVFASDRLAWAEGDDPSAASGRFGLVLTLRDNLGDLGDLYKCGFLWGFHAGLDKPVGESDWHVGVAWSTLVRGYYFSSDSSQVNSTIHLTEVNLGVNASHTVFREGQRAFGTGGAVLLLSNLPIPPANERRYLGWYAGIGYKRNIVGEWTLGVEARYSRLSRGLANLNLVFGITAGL
jgi:hypothetical protein